MSISLQNIEICFKVVNVCLLNSTINKYSALVWMSSGLHKISVEDRNLRLLYADERVQFSEGLQPPQEYAILF